MSIANKLPTGNSESNTGNDTPGLGVGNIVPHWWYKEIQSAGDKPDLVAISILAELYFLYRKNNGAEFNDGYTYFEHKFDFTRCQLKNAITRLDRSGLAIKTFRAIIVNGRNFPNELYLKLNLPNLLQVKTKYIPQSADYDVHSSNANNNIDIAEDDVTLEGGTVGLLFWGVSTSNQRGKHQPLKWCNPRFNGRGDNSVYNRLLGFLKLKTIITVVGGLLNSPIAKASINNSIIHTYFGNQNSWSLTMFHCFRPLCFNSKGGHCE